MKTPLILCSDNFPPDVGGTPTLFWNVYSRFAGGQVTVLTAHSAGAASAEAVGPVHVVRRPGRPATWGVVSAVARRYYAERARQIREISGGQPVVVHAGRNLPEGLAACLARVKYGVPYIVWAHGEELATANSSRELSVLSRLVYGLSEHVIANSQSTRSLLRGCGVRASKITVAYPGVDTDRFSPHVNGEDIRTRYARPGESLILTVGRLQRRKGHDLSIDAMSALVSRGYAVRYLIVGDGEERAALEERVRARGLERVVSLVGVVPGDDLPRFYAASDVFLMPNRVQEGDLEGFGIVFIEAAASAKPVVGGVTGGAGEAVEDGVTGVLVSGLDADELARVLEALLRSPELRGRLGEAGRRRVMERFTWPRTATVVEGVHDAVATCWYDALP
jgi:phosphatidylinositol alpha-1,6-mannosyltransferase